jgi:hypothetical protein
MSTKRKTKRKYKTKAGSLAKAIEDPIQTTRGEINLQELEDIVMDEQFMQDIQQLDPLFARLDQLNEENQNREPLSHQGEEQEERQFMQYIQQLDPLLARLDQLNEENQNRGRLFRQREEEEERQLNRNIRQRTARGKKIKRRKTTRGRAK